MKTSKRRAEVTSPTGRRKVVFIQPERDGSEWATVSAMNRDQGYLLRSDGKAETRTYKNGEIVRSALAGTWKYVVVMPNFLGRDIKTQVVAAVEAIESGTDIVTFSAGENMPIRAGLIQEDDDTGMVPEYAWDGSEWNEIGYL